MAIICSDPEEDPNVLKESDVDRLDQELVEMDTDVVLYFNDPQSHDPPDHERLIARIRSLPEHPGQTGTLQLKISNLKYKTYYFERSWRQIRENALRAEKERRLKNADGAAERRQTGYLCAPNVAEKAAAEQKGINITDMLYQMQEAKRKQHAAPDGGLTPEPKPAFRKRILSQYKALKAGQKSNQKLILVWNAAQGCCDLMAERRGEDRSTDGPHQS